MHITTYSSQVLKRLPEGGPASARYTNRKDPFVCFQTFSCCLFVRPSSHVVGADFNFSSSFFAPTWAAARTRFCVQNKRFLVITVAPSPIRALWWTPWRRCVPRPSWASLESGRRCRRRWNQSEQSPRPCAGKWQPGLKTSACRLISPRWASTCMFMKLNLHLEQIESFLKGEWTCFLFPCSLFLLKCLFLFSLFGTLCSVVPVFSRKLLRNVPKHLPALSFKSHFPTEFGSN